MSCLRIAIAQLNLTVGDFSANTAKLIDYAQQAFESGADVLLAPELAVSGYPPEDLLLLDGFHRFCDQALQDIAEASLQMPGMVLVIGHPQQIVTDDSSISHTQCFNAASAFCDGVCIATYHKQKLPNHGVFDERRYFCAGETPCVLEISGVSCALAICQDVWQPGVVDQYVNLGVEVLLVLNASPLYLQKQSERICVLSEQMASTNMALVYVNLVGAQDELVFDGGSFILDSRQQVQARLPQFIERMEVLTVATNIDAWPASQPIATINPIEQEAYQALVLGVRDYFEKNSFPGVLLGLSGGIDSALTLCIAVDALGAKQVRTVMMPSPYTASMSIDDSRELVKNLGVSHDEISIQAGMETFADLLKPLLSKSVVHESDTTDENLQARIRGIMLMALSNRTGFLVLTAGNKSEMAVGYATLYGDMAGGFSVLKDVYKTLVYRLAKYRNTLGENPVIPENIIQRPPSAELKPEQTDQDTLPDYEMLDEIIQAVMEENLDSSAMVSRGLPEKEVSQVLRMLRMSEYKRRQAPVGIRITKRGFGKDWRYPIAHRFTLM